MPTIYQPAVEGEAIVSTGGKWTYAVTAASIAAGVVLVKVAPGRLCKVLVTTALSATAVIIYDNASAGSGTVIGYVPASATIGTVYDFQMPANNGIVIGQAAGLSTGGLTISFT
jgi:hypothetical protein